MRKTSRYDYFAATLETALRDKTATAQQLMEQFGVSYATLERWTYRRSRETNQALYLPDLVTKTSEITVSPSQQITLNTKVLKSLGIDVQPGLKVKVQVDEGNSSLWLQFPEGSFVNANGTETTNPEITNPETTV